MTPETILQIFRDTAYIRTGGSAEELRCAEYLIARCADMGLEAHLDPFAVDMATIKTATLEADGEVIPCRGYLCAGSHTVEAPLYYLRSSDRLSLAACRGKIVLFDGYLGYWRYRELIENGAVGFISYDGHVNYPDCDIDQRELRSYVSKGEKLPGVNINVKSAMSMIERGVKTVKITLEQDEYVGESRNVVLDMPGESADTIVFTAHYDSTSLSQGTYDNMSGCVGLLGLIEYFRDHPHRCSLRFIFCGSEERGLLGAKAYCAAHEAELEQIVLDINIDMIGCTMGRLIAYCSAEEAVVSYLTYLGCELGVSIAPRQGIHSSDSTPFADCGIPAVSFARSAPGGTATIHNAYDTIAVMRGEQMAEDIAFITAFADRMANAVLCPVKREIPDKVKDEIDRYLLRKK